MRGWNTENSDGQQKFKRPAILQRGFPDKGEDLTSHEQESTWTDDGKGTHELHTDTHRTDAEQEDRGALPGEGVRHHAFDSYDHEDQAAEEHSGDMKPGDKGAADQDHVLADEKKTPIPKQLEQFREMLENEVGLGESFDVVAREMTFGNRRTSLFFINGFVKDTVLTEVLKRLTFLHPDQISPDALHSFFDLYVPAVQVVRESDFNLVVDAVLAGSSALYIEHEESALLIDAKAFPARNPEEPTLERVVRGSRDGFVETLLVNVTLVRRRLRDPGLRYEMMKIGRRTKTDVCIAYINDIADPELLDSIKAKLEEVEIDGLPMADKQLEEATVKRGWNPYPLVRYSERPDVVAAQLLEGNIAVFVDTTPSVMLLPTTFFDLIQHAEENRQTPFIGTFLRWVRFFGILASLFFAAALVPVCASAGAKAAGARFYRAF